MPAKTNRIAFQGEPGANSDTACRNVYPEMEPLPCPTFEDAFNAVETGKADLAMIPIENTIAGRVADIHHLLPESRLHIIGEYFLPIHFQLMVLKGVAARKSPPCTATFTHWASAANTFARTGEGRGGRRHGRRGCSVGNRRPHHGRAGAAPGGRSLRPHIWKRTSKTPVHRHALRRADQEQE